MKVTALDTVEATNKWWAAQDRAIKNTANKSHYTAAQQLRATRIQLVLQQVYKGTVYEPSYGIKGISVKVKKDATLADRKGLRSMEADWTTQGIVKKITAQGTTYRIPKQ